VVRDGQGSRRSTGDTEDLRYISVFMSAVAESVARVIWLDAVTTYYCASCCPHVFNLHWPSMMHDIILSDWLGGCKSFAVIEVPRRTFEYY
jgi:hypothetical protein